jgi:hypothetical protein
VLWLYEQDTEFVFFALPFYVFFLLLFALPFFFSPAQCQIMATLVNLVKSNLNKNLSVTFSDGVSLFVAHVAGEPCTDLFFFCLYLKKKK